MGIKRKMTGGNDVISQTNIMSTIVNYVESYRDQNPAVHKLWDYFYFLIIFIGGFMITFFFTINTTPIFRPLVAFCIMVGIFLIFFIVYNFYLNSNIKTLVSQSNIPIILSVASIILGGLMTFISTVIVLVTMTYIMTQSYSSSKKDGQNLSSESYNMSNSGNLMVSDRNYANIWRFIELTFTKMFIIVPLTFIIMYQNLDDDILENSIGENKMKALTILLSFVFILVIGISITEMFYSIELLNTKLKGAAGVGTHPI